MTGVDLLFQLFALLLGLSIAELLAGLARSWRISTGATKTDAQVRIGWLVPLVARVAVSVAGPPKLAVPATLESVDWAALMITFPDAAVAAA